MILKDNKKNPLYPQTTLDQVIGLQDKLDTMEAKIDKATESYVHVQTTAASTWNITHNLDKYPTVTVVSNGSEVICEVKYIDSNSVQCLFTSNVSGIAYIN